MTPATSRGGEYEDRWITGDGQSQDVVAGAAVQAVVTAPGRSERRATGAA